ncbi:MAG: divalent-cation tolerance protein CutA [Candidatus Asgardarchaeia archaeon]
MTEKYIQVLTTVEKEDDAKKISKVLLEKKLAACIQIIGPIKSMYWWKEKIEEATEYILAIKTKAGLYEELEKTIKEIHPYEVPEIIAIPIEKGLEDYLNWIKEVTKD